MVLSIQLAGILLSRVLPLLCVTGPSLQTTCEAVQPTKLQPCRVLYGSFRRLGVPYFGVLITRILLFRGPYNKDPTI